jgi:hypothetical protein
MKNLFFTALIAVLGFALTVGASQNAMAQKFELGVRAGVVSPDLQWRFASVDDAKAQLGWHLAAVSRIRVLGFGDGITGAGLFLQPEVVYSQNRVKMDGSKFRMQNVDFPLLLSAKLSIFRVNAGPVFNLMNNVTSVSGKMEWAPSRYPVGYAVGASVDLFGLVIDGRYHGDFKKLKGALKNGDEPWTEDIKGTLSSWSVGVGFMF